MVHGHPLQAVAIDVLCMLRDFRICDAHLPVNGNVTRQQKCYRELARCRGRDAERFGLP